MSDTYRPCGYCKKPCYGEHCSYEYDRGNRSYYHNRCHAESQDRSRYPQQEGGYVAYDSPADKLQREKEKESLLQKQQIEFDFFKKMEAYKKDDRKEFMDAVLKKLEDLEDKMDQSRQEMVSEMANMIKQSEEKIMASLEEKMENRMEETTRNSRPVFFSSPLSFSSSMVKEKQGSTMNSDKKRESELKEVGSELMSAMGEMMKSSQLEIMRKMDAMELQREEKMEKVRKEVVSSVSALINGKEQKEAIPMTSQFVPSTAGDAFFRIEENGNATGQEAAAGVVNDMANRIAQEVQEVNDLLKVYNGAHARHLELNVKLSKVMQYTNVLKDEGGYGKRGI